MRLKNGIAALAGLLIVGLVVSPVLASRTSMWFLEDAETLSSGEFVGTGLDADGNIQPTDRFRTHDVRAQMTWDIEADGDGYLVATSLPASLKRVSQDGTIQQLAESGGLGFTALAGTDEAIYAASSPGGDIHRYDRSEGTLEVVATLEVDFVWDLVTSSDGRILAGTGTEGRIYELENGEVRNLGRVPGPNVMALTEHDGNLYAGDDQGGLYRRGDRWRSVYGFTGGEVNSLLTHEGSLYVGVNHLRRKRGRRENQDATRASRQVQSQTPRSDTPRARDRSKQNPSTDKPDSAHRSTSHERPGAGQQAPSVTVARDQNTAGRDGSGPVPTQESGESSAQGNGSRESAEQSPGNLFNGLMGHSLYRLDSAREMTQLTTDDQGILHDLTAASGELYMATGPEGRLVALDEDGRRRLHASLDQTHVLTALGDDKGLKALATGGGGTLQLAQPFEPGTAMYRSTVLDAGFLSSWGQIQARASGTVELRTRSGNTEDPNELWSDWSRWRPSPRVEVGSPPGRFLQVEVRFKQADLSLSRLEIPHRSANQLPRIADLQVQQNPIHRALKQPLKESAGPSGPSEAARNGNSQSDVPLASRSIQWEVNDPDGDPAASKLEYRPVDGEGWISLHDKPYLKETRFQWDVGDLSDGYYMLRLTVTDKHFNPPGTDYQDQRVEGPFLVDNTPPTLENLRYKDGTLRFRAVDDHSRIIRAQYRVDDGTWQSLRPKDGLLDQHQEDFEQWIEPDVSDKSYLQVRIMDEAGNRATGALTVKKQ